MKYLIRFSLLCAACILVFSSCQQQEKLSDVIDVTSFGFAANIKIGGLDGYVFSVDLVGERIYLKEDSLPYLSDSAFYKLKPVVSPTSFSQIYFNDNLWNRKDSIDFSSVSKGIPVTMRVVSGDGTKSKTYSILFSSHRVDPEKINWSPVNSAISQDIVAEESRAFILSNATYYYFIKNNGGSYKMFTTADPAKQWQERAIFFPTEASIRTIQMRKDTFYVAANGKLWYSTDGINWALYPNFTLPISSLMASFGSNLVARSDDQIYTLDVNRQLAPTLSSLPAGFPVSGFAAFEQLTVTKVPKVLLLGGVSGELAGAISASVWSSFDGQYWVDLTSESTHKFPARVGAVAFNYADKFYITGGLDAHAQLLDTIYTSPDGGLNWYKAAQNVHLPKDFAGKFIGVDAIESPTDRCIYLIGIKSDYPQGRSQVWKGIINRYNFLIQKK